MPKTRKKETKEVLPTEIRFPKQDILLSDEFTKIERDFLSAYLPDGYHSIDEAKKVLEKIRKGAVK